MLGIADEGRWFLIAVPESARPPPRYGHAMAISPTHLYVYGGFNNAWFGDMYEFSHGDDSSSHGGESMFGHSNGLVGLQEDLLGLCQPVYRELAERLRKEQDISVGSASNMSSASSNFSVSSDDAPLQPLAPFISDPSLATLATVSPAASMVVCSSSPIDDQMLLGDTDGESAAAATAAAAVGTSSGGYRASAMTTTSTNTTTATSASATAPFTTDWSSSSAPLPGEQQDHFSRDSSMAVSELDASLQLFHEHFLSIRCPTFDFRAFVDACASPQVLFLTLSFIYTDDIRFALQTHSIAVSTLVEAAHWAQKLQLERMSALLEAVLHLRITTTNYTGALQSARHFALDNIVAYIEWFLVETQEANAQESSTSITGNASDAPLQSRIPPSRLVSDMEQLLERGMQYGDFCLVNVDGAQQSNGVLGTSHNELSSSSSLSSSLSSSPNGLVASATPINDTNQIRVFRALLRVRCPYFASMFDMGGLDSLSDTSLMRDISMSVLHHLVRYIYTGMFPSTATMSEFLDLMVALVYYQLDQRDQSVVEACDAFITSNLKLDNCLDVCRLAFERGLVEVQRKSVQLIARNYGRVVPSADVLHSMDNALVIEILHAVNLLLWNLQFGD
jgi:hypothetical protein